MIASIDVQRATPEYRNDVELGSIYWQGKIDGEWPNLDIAPTMRSVAAEMMHSTKFSVLEAACISDLKLAQARWADATGTLKP